MTLSLDTRVNLADDTKMPVLGLGVWRAASGKETQRAGATALDVGYRLIDTAKLYGNERDVGQAVRASKIPRDQIFITTKLWNTDHGYEGALRAFEQSRRELGVDSIDLYLIHWPVPGLRQESWKGLLRLKEKGLARSIGVSNYTIRHLEELLSSSPIPPDARPDLDPLGSPARPGGDPESVQPARIRENARVFDFELSRADMARLDALDERSHVAWDPDDLP